MLINGEYYLVTADEWFVGPDGEEYRAAWGKCELVEAKESFGFVPLRPSTNWFCKLGKDENSIILAGCQIHYAIKCKTRPIQKISTYTHQTTGLPTIVGKIYFTE